MGVALEQEHVIVGPFHGSTGSYISFDQEFVKYPYISIMLVSSGSITPSEEDDEGHDHADSANVNAFIRTVSVKGFDVEFSSGFSGYVHYIAARRM